MEKKTDNLRIAIVVLLVLLVSTACNLFQSSTTEVVEEVIVVPEELETVAPEFVPEVIYRLVPDFGEDDSWPMNSVTYSADGNQLATGTF